MKRHTEEKKHKCEYCPMRFFSNHHKSLHQSKVHREVMDLQPEIQDTDDDDLNKIMNDGDLTKFINTDDIMRFLV